MQFSILAPHARLWDEAMLAASIRFLRDDLSVRNFIRSDFAMLNTRLKNHYSLKGAEVIPGKGLQRVGLEKTYRSGLVTQGSILKVTADGSVTSPVLRGVWVNERILESCTMGSNSRKRRRSGEVNSISFKFSH